MDWPPQMAASFDQTTQDQVTKPRSAAACLIVYVSLYRNHTPILIGAETRPVPSSSLLRVKTEKRYIREEMSRVLLTICKFTQSLQVSGSNPHATCTQKTSDDVKLFTCVTNKTYNIRQNLNTLNIPSGLSIPQPVSLY